MSDSAGDNDSSLQPLADLLAEVESPDFTFGEWVPPKRPAPGVVTMAYFAFSPQGLALVAAMPVQGGLDWAAWKETDDARRLLSDPAMIAQATPDELIRLSTTLVRSDRFTDGELANAWASGVITAIVRRAAALTGQVSSPADRIVTTPPRRADGLRRALSSNPGAGRSERRGSQPGR